MYKIRNEITIATITEDYVSFEVAKLLKEKGFNEEVLAVYIYDSLFVKGENNIVNTANVPIILAPTLQMAMKWLREVHGLSVEIFSIKGTSNICPVFWKGNVVKLLTQDYVFNGELVSSYEEACEAAIKYCLKNLI